MKMVIIDQIRIQVGSGHSVLSLAEWGKVPLIERLDAIKEKRVQFLSDGKPVAILEALAAIKAGHTR